MELDERDDDELMLLARAGAEGAFAVSVFDPHTVTWADGVAPKLTVSPSAKPVPEIRTA